MAGTNENKQFPSFALADDSHALRIDSRNERIAFATKGLVFRFLFRALIWFVRFLSLDKTHLFVLSFSRGALWTADNDRLSCARCGPDANWPQDGTHPQQATTKFTRHFFFFSLHTAMSMLMYHGTMKRRKWEGGHKCVWCMQGLMESTFASTLGTKQERWEGERHPSETERPCPNGEGK